MSQFAKPEMEVPGRVVDLAQVSFTCDVVARDWLVRHGLARVLTAAYPKAAIQLHADTGSLAPTPGSQQPAVAVWLPEGIDGVDILSAWQRTNRRVIGLGQPDSASYSAAPITWVGEWQADEALVVDAVARALTELDASRIIQLPGGMARRNSAAAMALTPRQEEVLRHLAQGLSNAEIAQALGMSENTVRIHVSAILKTLRVANRTQAALWATQNLESGHS
jgi:DNA-binding CsgD family transcriptional regulator